jgi:hypothetical protein
MPRRSCEVASVIMDRQRTGKFRCHKKALPFERTGNAHGPFKVVDATLLKRSSHVAGVAVL